MVEFNTLNELVGAAEVQEKRRRRETKETNRLGGEVRADGETPIGDGVHNANGRHKANGEYKANGKDAASVPPLARPAAVAASRGDVSVAPVHPHLGTASSPPDREADAAHSPTAPKRKRREWAPDQNDRWVYELVKFDGLSQMEAASRARISQSSVSRIIQRYERWKAHAEERDDGELDPAERLRAQRWLTFERNERMLASALRLAKEMGGTRNCTSPSPAGLATRTPQARIATSRR
jgi:hypothetical protein